MTTEESHKLATGVIECAVRDAQGRVAGDRVAAIAWLASRQASIWFDALGLSQAAFLEKLEWTDMAVRAMLSSSLTCSQDEFDTIMASVEYFESITKPSLQTPVTV